MLNFKHYNSMVRYYSKKFYPTIRLVEMYKYDFKLGLSFLIVSFDGCKIRKCVYPFLACKICPFNLRLTK